MRTWLGKALLGLLVALGGILLLELAARAVWPDDGVGRTSGAPEWFIYSLTLGWEPRPHFAGYFFGHTAHFDAAGRRIAPGATSSGGRPTILLLGDSHTQGFAVADQDTFAARLGQILGGIEVANMGVSGYTSYQGLVALETKALPLRPHLALAAFNFNDRRTVLAPDQQDGPEHFRRIYRAHLVAPVQRLGLARALRSALPGVFGPGAPGPPAVDVRSLSVRVPPEDYRANLERIAELAARHGVRLIFAQFGDNPSAATHLRQGLAHRSGGRTEEAAAAFQASIQGDHWMFRDLARLRLSEAYALLGRKEEAERVAWTVPLGWPHGGLVLHPDSLYAAIMHEVAERHGVPVFDGRSLLDKDPSVYFDFAHFDARGHALVAEGLARFLLERGLLAGALPRAR